MMNFQKFEQQVQEAQQRLENLQNCGEYSSKTLKELQQETLTELFIALEELNVATEEIQQQNEELMATRQELELERQRYQELFDFAPDGYLVTDERGIIQEANFTAANLLNLSRQFLSGKPLDIFINPAERDIFNSKWLRIKNSLAKEFNNTESSSTNKYSKNREHNYSNIVSIGDWEINLQPREKEPLPVIISISASCATPSQGITLHWLFRDVSDRKQAEQKIREQAALLDVATDAIFVSDFQDRILFWNKGAEKLYGWKKEEAIGKQVDTLLYRSLIPELAEIKREITIKGEWKGELNQITKTGSDVIVESRWSLVKDDRNNPQSILIVNTDITLSKKLQAQYFRHQRLESLGILASGISHDLNNILTPILGFAQLLPIKIPNADKQQLQMFGMIENNAKRGAALLKQILRFARGVEGEKELLLVSYLLSDIKQVAQEIFPKSIAIVKQVPSDLWAINGDITQLHQVCMNLCLNAKDAMPNGGILTIAAENFYVDENYAHMEFQAKVGHYVIVTVSDTGTGIAPEIIKKIFDPFFTTKEKDKGTGLGLANVISIVQNHDGFIKVSSELQKGTQFRVFLPAQITATQETKLLENKENLLRGNDELILVVDDETNICQFTQSSLSTYGYRVLTASNGIEAIGLYVEHKHEISVVLMDIMMPSMDGIATIRILQQINPQVKIIITSGLTFDNPIYQSLDKNENIKAFLSKPFTSTELLTILHKVFNPQPPIPNP
jgi:two-component system, cell cycle sensor histidine kinase and response regulator CckA